MSHLLSSNPEERARAVAFLVRRLMAEHRVSDTDLAEKLGRSRQRVEKQLSEGRLYLDDLLVLERMLPGLMAELASPIGMRVSPDLGVGSARDLIAAIGDVIQGVGATASTTAAAMPDGIDGPEALAIGKQIRRAISALGTLEASVAAAVTMTRSRR